MSWATMSTSLRRPGGRCRQRRWPLSAQGDSPFMLDQAAEPAPEPAARATYRIAVGKRQKDRPPPNRRGTGQRGWLEEQGLRAHRHPRGSHLGGVTREPAGGDLEEAAQDRISGKLIELTLDTGSKPHKPTRHKGRPPQGPSQGQEEALIRRPLRATSSSIRHSRIAAAGKETTTTSINSLPSPAGGKASINGSSGPGWPGKDR